MPKYKEANGIVKIDMNKIKIDINLQAEKIKKKNNEENIIIKEGNN